MSESGVHFGLNEKLVGVYDVMEMAGWNHDCRICRQQIEQGERQQFKDYLLELDRKHSGRQGAIWADIVKEFSLSGGVK